MHAVAITLFPAMFDALTEHGISSRAVTRGLLTLETINPRDFAGNNTGRVDDRPYGGGPGMVMSVPPLRRALQAARGRIESSERIAGTEAGEGASGTVARKPLTVCLSPQGEPLTQQRVAMLAAEPSIILLCGRYEGIDERLLERDVDLEISLGDYVISGGELAAMVLLDAMLRLQPGALGDDSSAEQDSFSGVGLLDCPHYTRPEEYEGQRVPEVLLGGDHAAIAQWRLEQAMQRTLQRRPELMAELEEQFGEREREIFEKLRRREGRAGDSFEQ